MNKSRSVRDLVRNVLHKGQSVAELLNAMIVPDTTKEVKIMAWKKYDECFDAFLTKRVNAICDVYHYYSSIIKLPVQDLNDLHKIPLLNPSKAARCEDFVNLLNAGILECHLFFKPDVIKKTKSISNRRKLKRELKTESEEK